MLPPCARSRWMQANLTPSVTTMAERNEQHVKFRVVMGSPPPTSDTQFIIRGAVALFLLFSLPFPLTVPPTPSVHAHQQNSCRVGTVSVRGTDPSGPQGPSGEKIVSSVGGTEDGNSVPTCTGDSEAWRLGALSSVNRPEGGGNRCWLNEKRAKSIKEEKKKYFQVPANSHGD